MALTHYMLGEQGEVIPIQVLDEQGMPIFENMRKLEASYSNPNRQIANNYYLVGQVIRVSTVFWSEPYYPPTDPYPPLLFQSKVFAAENVLQALSQGEHSEHIFRRYATKEEAIQGHQQMCVFIETCLAQGLIPEPIVDNT